VFIGDTHVHPILIFACKSVLARGSTMAASSHAVEYWTSVEVATKNTLAYYDNRINNGLEKFYSTGLLICFSKASFMSRLRFNAFYQLLLTR